MFASFSGLGQIWLFHRLFNANPLLTVCILGLIVALAWHFNSHR